MASGCGKSKTMAAYVPEADEKRCQFSLFGPYEFFLRFIWYGSHRWGVGDPFLSAWLK